MQGSANVLFRKFNLQKNLPKIRLHRKYFVTSVCRKNTDDPKQNASNESKYNYVHRKLLNGPNLKDFFRKEHIRNQENIPESEVIPYLQETQNYGLFRKVYFDVYGCQMNVNDTEIIWSILKSNNFLKTDNLDEADIVLIVTCAIRESAESKIWHRLVYLNSIKIKRAKLKNKPKMKIGILGCMAERLKEKVNKHNRFCLGFFILLCFRF